MKRYRYFLLLVAGFIVLSACSKPEPAGEVLPDIDTVTWQIGNVPGSFWPDGSGPSAVINFAIYFKSQTISASDLKGVTITNSVAPDSTWNYTSSELSGRVLTSSDNKKYLSLKHIYSDSIAKNGSVIFLGVYTLTIELRNGKSATQEVSISAPDSLESGNFRYAYSEEFSGKPSAEYVALPKRATIDAITRNPKSTALTLKFSVNDNRIYSGWVKFYDQNYTLLGQTKLNLRDFASGDLHPKLNGGKAFHTDGKLNTLRLGLADIAVKDKPFNIADIASIHLVLTDGKQYAGTKPEYTTFSYSSALVNKP